MPRELPPFSLLADALAVILPPNRALLAHITIRRTATTTSVHVYLPCAGEEACTGGGSGGGALAGACSVDDHDGAGLSLSGVAVGAAPSGATTSSSGLAASGGSAGRHHLITRAGWEVALTLPTPDAGCLTGMAMLPAGLPGSLQLAAGAPFSPLQAMAIALALCDADA